MQRNTSRITLSIRKHTLMVLLCAVAFVFSLFIICDYDFHVYRIPNLLLPSGEMPWWYVRSAFWRTLAVAVVQAVSLLSAHWLLKNFFLLKATPKIKQRGIRSVFAVLIFLQTVIWVWFGLHDMAMPEALYNPDNMILPLLTGIGLLLALYLVRRLRLLKQGGKGYE